MGASDVDDSPNDGQKGGFLGGVVSFFGFPSWRMDHHQLGAEINEKAGREL